MGFRREDEAIVNSRVIRAYSQTVVSAAIAAMCLFSTGCNSAREPVNEKPVVPVTGTILVDGAPVAGVRIKFHSTTPEESHRVFPKALTDADGTFEAWTYRKGDGLAAGEYTVTFLDHSTAHPGMRESEKVDLFEGMYANPKTTEHTITVPDTGEPFDIGTIDLKP